MRIVIGILLAWVIGLGTYLLFDEYWPGGNGSFVVISEPPGADIWLDLKPSGQTTNGMLTEIPSGEHSVTVKKSGFRPNPFVHVVKARKGATDTLRFKLVEADEDYHEPGVGQSKLVPPKSGTIEDQVREDMPWDVPRVAPQSTPELTSQDTFARKADSLISSFKYESETKPAPPTREPASEEPANATVEISTSVPGANVFIDGKEQDKKTPSRIQLPTGIYTISVELEGYKVTPDEQIVRVSRAASAQFVFFTLVEAQNDERQFTITTIPIEGDIFMDSVLVGHGKAVVPHEFGTYTFTFGQVADFRTPDPVRLTATPANPNPEFTATYSKSFYLSATANSSKELVADGGIKTEVGVYEKGRGAKASESHGPTIEKIPGTEQFGWELAMGDANRNPTGGDYIEFVFDLPLDVPPSAPLNLRLYLYRSTRRYPLSLSNRSEITVTVNGRVFLDSYRPRNETEMIESARYEEWSLQHTLVPGENRIMIRTTDQNSIYNYLWKFEIL